MPLFGRRAVPALLLLAAVPACASRYAATNAPPPCTSSRMSLEYERSRMTAEQEWERRVSMATTTIERERLNGQRISDLKRADDAFWRRYRAAVQADSAAGCKP
jgi:hypothetical protein